MQQVAAWERKDEIGDERIRALAAAMRVRSMVRIRIHSAEPRVIHSIALRRQNSHWWVLDKLNPSRPIALAHCKEIIFRRAPSIGWSTVAGFAS